MEGKDNKKEIIFFRGSVVVLILLIIAAISISVIKNNQNKENINSIEHEIVYEAKINILELALATDEDVTIYIGKNGEFESFNGSLNTNTPEERQAINLVTQIGYDIGYNIIVENVEIGEKNITVNLRDDSAPFDIDNTYIGLEDVKYHIEDKEQIKDIIFDSIKQTLKQYFGKEIIIGQ